MYAEYRQTELKHREQESELFDHIDSLRAQNEEQQHAVDSLNRLLDSLVIKATTPSPREVVRRKAAALHLARHEAICQAVRRREIKTMKEAHSYDGGLNENFKQTERSIKDPVLHEEFMQAYFSYFNLNDQLYDSLARVLPEE